MSMITILGPTATGKTQFASHLAYQIGGEIISADSRQVYRGMTIGTGKDLSDYHINGINIPYHLVDIAEPGTEYNVFNFTRDFSRAYNNITKREKKAILCGGTGMYLEAILKGYNLTEVPVNHELRKELSVKTQEELNEILLSFGQQHNNSDLTEKERTIRAIEIKTHYSGQNGIINQSKSIESLVCGIHFDRAIIRERITLRLHQRLANGMIEEVEELLKSGITAERLIRYGLEYKYITLYLTKQLNYKEMTNLLNIAIHQFAKRQMTWFRRMEKQGIKIHWIDGNLSMEEKVKAVFNKI